MKNITKYLFIFMGLLLWQGCSDDSDDFSYNLNIDRSDLPYSQDVANQEGSQAVNVTFNADGEGTIYYAVFNAADEYEVSALGLREQYGMASGSGISGQLTGGSINVDGATTEAINFTGYADNTYVIVSTAANSYDYVSDLKQDEVTIMCESEISDSYNTYAYSVDLNRPFEDAVAGNTPLTPVDGTDNQYFVESLWGENFVAVLAGNPDYEGQYIYPAILQVNDDNTVDVLPTGNEDDFYAVGGSGMFNPCDNTFDLLINQELFTGDFAVNVYLSTE